MFNYSYSYSYSTVVNNYNYSYNLTHLNIVECNGMDCSDSSISKQIIATSSIPDSNEWFGIHSSIGYNSSNAESMLYLAFSNYDVIQQQFTSQIIVMNKTESTYT